MKIEHVAMIMDDPVAAAQWYVRHLGFEVRRASDQPPYAHFLADSSATVMIEIYNNPKCPVPNYRDMDPLQLHLAFVSDDIEGDRRRLIEAGATADGDIEALPDGGAVAMLRDPWGVPIQLARRGKPMLA